MRVRRPGLFGLGHLKLLLRALQRPQRLFPLPFQRRRNQAVVGINLPITARRKRRFVGAPLQLKAITSACPKTDKSYTDQ